MKNLKYLFPVLVGVVLVAGGYFFFSAPNPAEANPSELNHTYLNDNIATTTLTYLLTTDTASTTIAFETNRVDSIDVNVLYNASSSASKLIWRVEFSHNNVDWFGQDGSTSASPSSVSHGAGSIEHDWTPGVAGVNLRNLTITPVGARYTRIRFGTAVANGGLWVSAVKKEQKN